MCGIAGIINLNKGKVKTSELKGLQNALKHRGPDGAGQIVSEHVGLAMRRLSIIDVEGGDQPLFNEDKTIEIIGNGEIFNYLELQKELKVKGHKLRTGSDIETAIHAYEEWGVNAVKKFRGQFALALHDKRKGVVVLFRDRMGEKPIYITEINGSVYFASEMKALITLPGFNKSLNMSAIDLFFHYYFIPEPLTLFKDTYKLAAGSYQIYDYKHGAKKHMQYWNPNDIKTTSKSDPTKQIKETFSKACTLTLRSDVPVGISLSGGIDSGAILAFSAPQYKEVMNAFSIGYEGTPQSDEREMARALAKQFKVNFIESEIKVKDVIKHFPKLIWDCDDPIADIAAHSIYEVSKIARKNGVKVLLGGAGGDELYWGYPSTIEATQTNIKQFSGIRKFINNDFVYQNPNPETTGKIIRALYSRSFKNMIVKNNFKTPIGKIKNKTALGIAKKSMDLVRDVWLKSDVITLGDRMSMAASIELRCPFLDYKLVENSLSSKKNVEAYKLGQKYYFKKAMEGILPNDVMQRPKRGFTPPVGVWISGIIKKYSKLLKDGFLVKEGILDKNKINFSQKILSVIPTYTAYQLLVLELWGRQYVYGERHFNGEKILK